MIKTVYLHSNKTETIKPSCASINLLKCKRYSIKQNFSPKRCFKIYTSKKQLLSFFILNKPLCYPSYQWCKKKCLFISSPPTDNMELLNRMAVECWHNVLTYLCWTFKKSNVCMLPISHVENSIKKRSVLVSLKSGKLLNEAFQQHVFVFTIWWHIIIIEIYRQSL